MFVTALKSAGAVLLTAILFTTTSSRAVADAKEKAPTATTPDGKIQATTEDKIIVLLDTATGKIRAKMNGHTGKVTALAFSPDGKILASGAADMGVRTWDAATGKELRRLIGKDTITSLTFSKDGKTLTAKEGATGKQTWEVATGKELE